MDLNDLESRLWATADKLWANTGLKPSEFSTPVLGLIFLRYAERRFHEVETALLKKGTPASEIEPFDYKAEGALYLPENARFAYLADLPEGEAIGKAINDAMAAVELANDELKGVLPRSYGKLDNHVLVELLRLLGPVEIEGDAFGKIYEYFLGNFALKEGQKGGVFYTPTSGTHKDFRAKGPGVVTGRSGSLGTVMFVEGDYWPLNTTLWVKTFKVGSPLYAFYLLSSIGLAGFNSGAAVPTLNRNDVHGLPVLKPTTEVLTALDDAVGPMLKLKRRLERKNANLRTTRDLLLPKLISGELDVSHRPEAEAMAA